MTKPVCKRRDHAFGASVSIGAGLRRRSCEHCGNVEIDLRGGSRPVDRPFADNRRTSWFEMRLDLTQIDPVAGQ